MKSLFVVSPAGVTPSRAAERAAERRKNQRRMEVPRRIFPDRRASNGSRNTVERRAGDGDRRSGGNRRRRPDRRIGLSPDLDLFLLGI
ncbi:MAG TPA: hypothetical protein VMR54_07820 [Thermoanaerobaculia bacterium]|nr:hypothetical protein [Thermoanaerobaculia bacterium]